MLSLTSSEARTLGFSEGRKIYQQGMNFTETGKKNKSKESEDSVVDVS